MGADMGEPHSVRGFVVEVCRGLYVRGVVVEDAKSLLGRGRL